MADRTRGGDFWARRGSDPSAGQSEQTVGEYLSKCTIGDEVAIRNTQAGLLCFRITKITGFNDKRSRVYTDHHELLAVQAFHFEPQASIARGVGRTTRFETIPSTCKVQARS
jgi:hypothetical protein